MRTCFLCWLCLLLGFEYGLGFVPTRSARGLSAFKMAKYEPQWKKKETIGGGDLDDTKKGLIGTVQVVFKQGNATRSTMAIPGQPISDVASQAGQFIKYGCGKGECGTCESLCNGKWIRPCQAVVPADAVGDDLVIQVKEIKAKKTNSGKFYSVRSFFMGFYNNALGMVGFVKARRAAKKNWEERIEYEERIRTLTIEKRKARLEREAQANSQGLSNTLKP